MKLLRVTAAATAALALATLVCGAAHATAALPWRTCVPQRTLYYGVYRVDNDLFDGAPGRSCIDSTTGHNLTILNSYAPGDGVVAYPDIRIGSFYLSRDLDASYLPTQVAHPDHVVMHLGSSCHAGGAWLSDADLWFYNSDIIRGHGTRELVIATCYTFDTACDRVFRIGRLRYCANEHLTGVRGHRWPLIVLRLIRPRYHTRVSLDRLLAVATIRHWIGGGKWLGSIAYGVECWYGCKGMAVSLSVNR